jgi:hypothetical protein
VELTPAASARSVSPRAARIKDADGRHASAPPCATLTRAVAGACALAADRTSSSEPIVKAKCVSGQKAIRFTTRAD